MGANLLNSSSASVFLNQNPAPSKAIKSQATFSADDKPQFRDVLDSTQKVTREESPRKSPPKHLEAGQSRGKAKEANVKQAEQAGAKVIKSKPVNSQTEAQNNVALKNNQKKDEKSEASLVDAQAENNTELVNQYPSQASDVAAAESKPAGDGMREELLENAILQSSEAELSLVAQLPAANTGASVNELPDTSAQADLGVSSLLPSVTEVAEADELAKVDNPLDNLGLNIVSGMSQNLSSKEANGETILGEQNLLVDEQDVLLSGLDSGFVDSMLNTGSNLARQESQFSPEPTKAGLVSTDLAAGIDVKPSVLPGVLIEQTSGNSLSESAQTPLSDNVDIVIDSINQQTVDPLVSSVTNNPLIVQDQAVNESETLAPIQSAVDRGAKLNLDEILKYTSSANSKESNATSDFDNPEFSSALKNFISVERPVQNVVQTDTLNAKPELPAQTTSSFTGASGFSLFSGSEVSQANRTFVVQTSVAASVAQPQWSEQVSEKVLWMASQKLHSAEIRLDPPELGPLQVKVIVHQDQAQVSFTSHHAQVREVLDQSLQRLRDMFSEQGMNLVNVDVSDRSFQRQQQGDQQQSGNSKSANAEEEVAEAKPVTMSLRLVDHYA